jgi:mRNA interferase RelE/StbE
MDSYKIQWKRSALKELKQLPKEKVGPIFKAVEELALNPFPNKVKKLTDSEHGFRIRVGDYRIIYNIFSKTLIIEIVRVKHRKEVYK